MGSLSLGFARGRIHAGRRLPRREVQAFARSLYGLPSAYPRPLTQMSGTQELWGGFLLLWPALKPSWVWRRHCIPARLRIAGDGLAAVPVRSNLLYR